ncbi:MAG: right-handed parallel beta-helix repeat-containing protein, partial [Planctomycetota bacterium]
SAEGPGATTIDCEGHRGFYFHSAEGPDSVLRGFTIVGAVAPGSQIPADNVSWNSSSTHPIGAGIFCEFSSPSIIDCVLRQCSAELGGGIGVVAGQPTVTDCTIEECQAGGQGAGIGLIRGSIGAFIDCTISRNVGHHNSLGAGGGLYCGGSSANLVLENCIISGNTADVGGGIYIGSSAGTSSADSLIESVDIINCTIARNTLSGTQTASSAAGGIHSVSSDIAIRNSIVWYNEGVPVLLVGPASNSPVLYSNIEGGYSGQGNVDADPLFASADGTDYHLRSVLGRYETSSDTWVIDNDYSPCIDAGDPQDPVGAEPLTNGKRINIGAYGGTVEASKGEGAWIFHVDGANGSNSNSGLSRNDAFATIQKAVDEALNGDMVMVWPGVYREQVVLESKAITLQSADDAAVVTAPLGYAFSFYYAESLKSVLRNFVITGCGEAAIYCDGASPMLTNLTVTGNLYGISAWGGANPDITNCILWNNQNGDLYHCRASYSDVEQEDAVGQNSGNISMDPLFADPANGDFHLMSRYGRYLASQDRWVTDSVTSPCIDAGDPSVHPGRERIPRGGRVNIGAYGGTPFASLSGWPSWSDATQVEPGSPVENEPESVFSLQKVLSEPESTTGTEDYRMVDPGF